MLPSKAVMHVVILVAVFLGAVSAVPRRGMPRLASLSPLEHTEHTIPEEYIVVFKEDANQVYVEDHMDSLNDMLTSMSQSSYRIKHKYHIGSFRGYSARMDDQTLIRVRSMREVDYVERNQRHSGNKCVNQKKVTWGLSRISHKKKQKIPKKYQYRYDDGMQGQGVDIYIIDSGIAVDNPQFKTDGVQRAIWGVDLVVDEGKIGYQKDETGHGTTVAGVAMSNKYGVAKKATAIAVRVIDAKGRTSTATAIKGYEYVHNQHKERKRPAVANASFGGPKDPDTKAEMQTIKQLIKGGVLVVTSAGNEAVNCKNQYPAAASSVGAVTVAASNEKDRLDSDSNYGKCVTIIAPGEDIMTTGNKVYSNNWPDVTESGTSLAAPFVTGVVANLLSGKKKLTPKQLKTMLKKKALKNKIKLSRAAAKANTPNLLLNYECV